MTNIIGAKNNSIVTNLKSKEGTYSKDCVDSRAVDAKTCLKAFDKFKRERDVEILFKKGLVCYQAVITSGSSYRKLSRDISVSKKSYQEFFRLNAEFLAYLSKKKRVISYAYSHEISVDSILEGDYRPHTHILFFVEKSHSPREQQLEVQALEKELNDALPDRTLSFVKKKRGGENLPLAVDNFPEIEGSFNYFFRAYSLADQYMREIRDSNVRELNLKTRECYRNLIYLLKSEDANGSKGVRRFRSSAIPKKGEGENTLDSLLQKKPKERKIEKKKVCTKSQAHVQETSSSTPQECCRQDQSGETLGESSSARLNETFSSDALGRSAGNSRRLVEFWCEHGGLLWWRRPSHVLRSFQDTDSSGLQHSCSSSCSSVASPKDPTRKDQKGSSSQAGSSGSLGADEQKGRLQQSRSKHSIYLGSSKPGGHFSISTRPCVPCGSASVATTSSGSLYDRRREKDAPAGRGRCSKSSKHGSISRTTRTAGSSKQQYHDWSRRKHTGGTETRPCTHSAF
jgi:hypothetical protein